MTVLSAYGEGVPQRKRSRADKVAVQVQVMVNSKHLKIVCINRERGRAAEKVVL